MPDDEPTPAVDATPSAARRRRRKSAWFVLAGAVALIIAGAFGLTAQRPPAPAPPSPPTTATSDPTSVRALRATPNAGEQRVSALTHLLERRAVAALAGDQAAWMATVDPTATRFAARQSKILANLRDVPFSDFRYEYTGVGPELSAARQSELGGTAWVGRVVVSYRLQGYDSTSTPTEQYLTVVQRGGRWLLAADSDGQTAPQPWDLGHVAVARGKHVLAFGTADASTLASYAEQGDGTVERVSKIWGSRWPRRAVLLVPRSEVEMGKLLLRGDGIDQIAAVTTGELSGSSAAGADRVVINPSAFSRLGNVGRRVVLTHEMTHVAVRSSTSGAVPIWLSEGFADYVGYQGVGLGRRTVAADVLALVRQGEGPSELPVVADFDPATTTIAPSYSAAWLASSLIADRYGQAKLVELYRTAAANPSEDPETALAQAFPAVLGTTEAKFTKSWLRYLGELASS